MRTTITSPCLKILVLVATILSAEVLVCAYGTENKIFPLKRAFPTPELEDVIARDRIRHASLLGVFSGIINFTLTGDLSTTGLYMTKIKLGTPPKEFNVIIDTGSDAFWVKCPHQSSKSQTGINVFDSARSSSASPISCSNSVCRHIGECAAMSNQCGFEISYAGGTGASGYYFSDMLHFDALMPNSSVKSSSTPIVFGCSTQLWGGGTLTYEDRTIDGILGLGQQYVSVISQLSSEHIIPRIFFHCLRGDGGGILVLGEILDEKIVYSPFVPSRLHYTLNLQSITIGGHPLPINPDLYKTSANQETIVDSGTTLLYLVKEAYDSLISVVGVTVAHHATPIIFNGYQCYKLSTRGIDIFPQVSFNFDGEASMILSAKDYILNALIEGVPLMCLGFQKASDQNPRITILGELALRDKIIIYDLDQQRLGWADFNCSTEVNVSYTSGRERSSDANLIIIRRSYMFIIYLIYLGLTKVMS